MLSEQDKTDLLAQGKRLADIEAQLRLFEANNFHLHVEKPCTIGDGITQLSGAAAAEAAELFAKNKTRFSKFVPASGAASRMFKPLAQYLDGNVEENATFAENVVTHLEEFAFYKTLEGVCKANGESLNALREAKNTARILELMLGKNGLNFAEIAKGLIEFHMVDGQPRTAVEEQLREAAELASAVHFTVPPAQKEAFETLVSGYLETAKLNLDVTYSVQNEASNTVAATTENTPFRDGNSIVFRPAGHGALLENLTDFSGDVVFVKNIDNIQASQGASLAHKARLGGFYVQIEQEIHAILRKLENDTLSAAEREAALAFLGKTFGFELDADIQNGDLFTLLNRPIRVCGMVKNVGEPGGGPFWVKNERGELRVQIVEKSQIDLANPAQETCAAAATHFNPVDLVCGLRDFRGEAFNLDEFVDKNAVFISEKSYKGKPLKALELPGLWNGAMANWLTVFVEVPLETFSPVKTVLDLLKPAHT